MVEQGESPDDELSRMYTGPDGRTVEIRNVWADNLEEEMAKIREIVETHPYVSMDTEFPGVVARPIGDFTQSDFQYQTLRCNVDLLKIIQLGLSFANAEGEFANGCCCWQFNFKFSLGEDMYAQDSIDLLKSSGIRFDRHETKGIDVLDFGELLMSSGLVLMDNVTWISFHSGYDFGYLLKVLTASALPGQEKDFFTLLKTYFPKLYDIKYLMANADGFQGGLNKLGDDLQIDRIGQKHQAGSDSLMTLQVFFRVCELKFGGAAALDKEKYNNELFGYGNNNTVYRPGAVQAQAQAAAANAAAGGKANINPNSTVPSYTVSAASNANGGGGNTVNVPTAVPGQNSHFTLGGAMQSMASMSDDLIRTASMVEELPLEVEDSYS